MSPSLNTDAQNRGREFEKEFAEEFGLTPTPASGAVWYSKLDLRGKKTRWSLKHTDSFSYKFNEADFNEAIEATEGLSGDGSIPLWAIRIGGINETFVLMRKDDFKLLQEGEILSENKISKSDERRSRSKLPVLLRDANAQDEFK